MSEWNVADAWLAKRAKRKRRKGARKAKENAKIRALMPLTEEQLTKLDKATNLRVVALNMAPERFYRTPEWRQLRYRALQVLGRICMLCGAGPHGGVPIHVDHIKPRSLWPELALKMDNLQILCEDCNLGKSNKDATDWRPIVKPILRKIGQRT